MSKPGYLLWIANGYKEAWYRLSEEERSELRKKCTEVREKYGGERLFTSKSPAGFPVFGAVVYPDMDSLRKSIAAHAEFHWPDRYMNETILVGTKV